MIEIVRGFKTVADSPRTGFCVDGCNDNSFVFSVEQKVT